MHSSTVVLWWLAVLCLYSRQGQSAKTPQGGAVVGVQCRRAEIPANRPQGSNRLSSDSWDPLYRLSVSEDGSQDYKVSIHVGNSLLPFSDAFISAETNGSCGVGEFHFDDQDFHRVVQVPASDCPHLLTSNRKSVMQALPPMRWKPPLCGCVQFRAMVIEASMVYYAEHANKSEGPLAITVCSPQTGLAEKEMTVEERTDLLCRVTSRHLGLSVAQRPRFLQNHGLQPTFLDTGFTDLALSNRHYDISQCCAKAGQESRAACLTNVRRRRVDALCANGVPDIPFSELRAAFMTQREEVCCWRLAGARYTCFSEGAEMKAGGRSADFSLDETDPLNDLADFEEELQSLEKEYGTTLIARTPFTTTHTTTPTTSTPTTTTTTTVQPALLPAIPQLRPLLPLQQYSPSSAFSSYFGQGSQGEHWPVQAWEDVGESSLPVSREVGEQGGRSVDKTFAALKQRMWKLSVKARCCRAGMGVAGATYGDFSAVWAQCQHSATKYLASNRLPQGHKMCANQFHRCCMESVVSLPSEVVTLAPDMASSREWDRDRHLIHTLYFPPHARPRPDMTASHYRQQHQQQHHKQQAELTPSPRSAQTSEERRLRMQKLKAPKPTLSAVRSLFVDEPEIDEEPQNKRPQSLQRPSSRERGGRSRARLDEDLSSLRRQKRLRNQNFSEQSKLRGRGSRERVERPRASRREFDLADVEEEPAFQKPTRKLSIGGRSKERRNMPLRKENPVPREIEEGVITNENQGQKSPENVQPQPPSDLIRSSKEHRKESLDVQQSAEERRDLGRQVEAIQRKKLIVENAEDVGEYDARVSLGDSDDNGSEETPDSLGLGPMDKADLDDEDDDFDDDDGLVDDQNDENENLVDDPDVDEIKEHVSKSIPEKPTVKPDDPDMQQSDEKGELQSLHNSKQEEIAGEESESEATVNNSEFLIPSPVAQLNQSQEIRRRSRLEPLGSMGRLSEEDGHSGGRSGRRKRKHDQKRLRNLNHHKRRLPSRNDRLELSEALEEE